MFRNTAIAILFAVGLVSSAGNDVSGVRHEEMRDGRAVVLFAKSSECRL